MTEATAARAATHNLNRGTRENCAGVRNHGLRRCSVDREVGKDRTLYRLLTARRQVQERQLVEAIESLLARCDLIEDGDDLLHPLLCLTHEEGVNEVCERHRVRRTRTTGEDDRVGVGEVGSANRNLREIDQLEYVRVRELGLQRDTEQVDIAHGAPRLERKQRHVVATHGVGHVRPRAVDALGRGVGAVVDQAVEDLQRLIRDPDLVRIGVGEGDLDRRIGLDGLVRLAADVARRLLDLRQKALDARLEGVLLHGQSLPGADDSSVRCRRTAPTAPCRGSAAGVPATPRPSVPRAPGGCQRRSRAQWR